MALEATPIIQPSENDVECAGLDLITEVAEFQDDCPVMPKLNAFVSSRGQCSTLEKVFKNRQGEAVDLTSCGCTVAPAEDSISVSEAVDEPFCGVKVRFMEITGLNNSMPVVEAEGTVTDAPNGKIQVVIPTSVATCPGIYRVSFGIFVNGLLIAECTSYLFVEAGLFGLEPGGLTTRTDGPPSILEIRMSIRDNMGENPLLFGDVEFSDSEIVFAITRPIREFDELPPPLMRRLSTKTFPWKEHWLKGIQAHLYHMAAMWYQRNRLQVSAGGMNIDDLNKQREYLTASELVRKEWKDFIIRKKTQISAEEFVGTVGSSYGGFRGLGV